MIAGLYTSANGMVALEEAQAAIANNIANASTTGFRRHQAVQTGFYQVFSNVLRRPAAFQFERAPGGGVKVAETFTDTAPGVLHTTGGPLDLAIEGSGYFVVETPRGERYTRDGNFMVDVDGDLATAEGYKVLSIDGRSMDVRGGNVVVDADGQIAVNGVPAGQVRLVAFEDPQRLRREGENLFRAPDGVTSVTANGAGTAVHQGRLESANVNLPVELTNMLLGLRAYEANLRAIHAADETVSQLIDRVAMP
ncbi:MAG TPA: flagellar basal-body rod protein FlgF [Candidatus Hydrogenedentes bacterium]|nr:flagellar basal-body rod protein FlgF [Candidatus Hydrogenedentota bacterium]HNT86321.1 flagellar basal-body rod protein FlgF [Candidatus Hydrogenedentota bacterium]